MKITLTILLYLSIPPAFGQKSINDLLEKTPQGRKGIRHFTKIIKLDSNVAEAYWRRGYEYYRTHQYRLAVPDFSKAILKDSTFNHATVLAAKTPQYLKA